MILIIIWVHRELRVFIEIMFDGKCMYNIRQAIQPHIYIHMWRISRIIQEGHRQRNELGFICIQKVNALSESFASVRSSLAARIESAKPDDVRLFHSSHVNAFYKACHTCAHTQPHTFTLSDENILPNDCLQIANERDARGWKNIKNVHI